MKKEQIYVPIGSEKEAKRAKAVLEAMGEVIDESYFRISYDENEGGLYFNEKYKTWVIAISFRSVRTKTTLKNLIELLVSEQKPAEKIAVRVDNDKEFNALMKYYDSLGWKSYAGKKSSEVVENDFPSYIDFHDKHDRTRSEELQKNVGYKIIPFSDFAKEHNIRVPIGVTHDGIDVYKGDVLCCVNIHHNKLGNDRYVASSSSEVETNTHHYFSTRQAALDWIEAQKPKVIEHTLCFGGIASVNPDKSEIEIGYIKLSFGDIHDLHTIITVRNS